METETYYVCSVEGCMNFVFEGQYKHLICIKHGDTAVRMVRQFNNGELVAEFKAAPVSKGDGNG
jgi:hypothetical protein